MPPDGEPPGDWPSPGTCVGFSTPPGCSSSSNRRGFRFAPPAGSRTLSLSEDASLGGATRPDNVGNWAIRRWASHSGPRNAARISAVSTLRLLRITFLPRIAPLHALLERLRFPARPGETTRAPGGALAVLLSPLWRGTWCRSQSLRSPRDAFGRVSPARAGKSGEQDVAWHQRANWASGQRKPDERPQLPAPPLPEMSGSA